MNLSGTDPKPAKSFHRSLVISGHDGNLDNFTEKRIGHAAVA